MLYPGQYFDAETGLYYNHHRYYAPELGRYLQPDPIAMLAPRSSAVAPGGAVAVSRNEGDRRPTALSTLQQLDALSLEEGGPYLYVRNRPLTLTDPTGLQGAGREACSYYDKICEQTTRDGDPDIYACGAAQCCRDFSEGLVDRCTRKCLIDNDQDCSSMCEPARGLCRTASHGLCYAECLKAFTPFSIPPSCSGVPLPLFGP